MSQSQSDLVPAVAQSWCHPHGGPKDRFRPLHSLHALHPDKQSFLVGASRSPRPLPQMASSASPKPPADTVILGAGIIGTSTAYYLSDVQDATSRIHLVEASPQLFASASGYAGGFLAKDWFSQPVAQLGALSFALHKELAEQHCGRDRWGYSPSIGISASDGGARGAGTVSGHDWMINGGSRAQISNKRHDFWGAGEERDERPKWLARREGMDVEIISAGHSTAQV